MLGCSIDGLATPAVLVDLDVLERNIARMAARARAGRSQPAAPRQDPQVPRDRPSPAGRGGVGPVARQGRRGRGVRRRRLRRPVRRLPRRRARTRAGGCWRSPTGSASRSERTASRGRGPSRRRSARRDGHARRAAEGGRGVRARRRASRAREGRRAARRRPAGASPARGVHPRGPRLPRRDQGGGRRDRPAGGRAAGRSGRGPAGRGPDGRRGVGRLDTHGRPRDARRRASPSAARATTSSTTPLR